MWGAIVGVAAASLALAVLHQTLESIGSQEKPKAEKPGQLEAPGPDFKRSAGGRQRRCGRGALCAACKGQLVTLPVCAPLSPTHPLLPPDGKFKAPLWQSGTKDVLNKAKRFFK